MATYKQRFEKILRDRDDYRSAYLKLLQKSADLQAIIDELENKVHQLSEHTHVKLTKKVKEKSAEINRLRTRLAACKKKLEVIENVDNNISIQYH